MTRVAVADIGSSGNDRTMKLQEPRKPGYGVRCSKHQAKAAAFKPSSAKPPHLKLQQPAHGRSKYEFYVALCSVISMCNSSVVCY